MQSNDLAREMLCLVSAMFEGGPSIRAMYPVTFEVTVQAVVASVYMLIMSAQSDAWNADIRCF
jgi:hypothetical protein